MNKRVLHISIAAMFAGALLVGCDTYNDKRGLGDAPIGKRSDLAWDIQQAPDGFGNIATRCSSFVDGQRLWVVTHGKTDVQPVITRDETCKADQP